MSLTPRTATHSVLIVASTGEVRRALGAVLDREPGLAPTMAASASMAAVKLEWLRPAAVVLDLSDVPWADGRALLARCSDLDVPVVCTMVGEPTMTDRVRVRAANALDVLARPDTARGQWRFGAAGRLGRLLREVLSDPGESRVRTVGAGGVRPAPQNAPAASRSRRPSLVAIGASAGGPQAIEAVLARLSTAAPGIVVVVHMPAAYTGSFARRLDSVCAIDVREAEAGDRIRPGLALVAPGGRHLRVRAVGPGLWVELWDGPAVNHHRPSVDVLFDSVTTAVGRAGLGLILSGMGRDGVEGLLRMRRAGALTAAQDQASCAVYGMPREAVAAGAAETVGSLEYLASLVNPSPVAGKGTSR